MTTDSNESEPSDSRDRKSEDEPLFEAQLITQSDEDDEIDGIYHAMDTDE